MASSFTSAGAALTTKQSSFREIVREQEDEKEEQNSIGASRQSELVEGEHRESRSRRFVLLLRFSFLPRKSRVVVVFR